MIPTTHTDTHIAKNENPSVLGGLQTKESAVIKIWQQLLDGSNDGSHISEVQNYPLLLPQWWFHTIVHQQGPSNPYFQPVWFGDMISTLCNDLLVFNVTSFNVFWNMFVSPAKIGSSLKGW